MKFWGGWRRSNCEYVYVDGDLDSKVQEFRQESKSRTIPGTVSRSSRERCRQDRPRRQDRSSGDSRTISKAVIEDEEKFGERIMSRLESQWGGHAGEDGGCMDVSHDEELSVAAKQMKLAGKLVLDLKDAAREEEEEGRAEEARGWSTSGN